MKTLTLEFTPAKVTKNTVKFDEVARPGEPKIMGSVYVQNFYVGKMGTENIRITLQVKDQASESFGLPLPQFEIPKAVTS